MTIRRFLVVACLVASALPWAVSATDADLSAALSRQMRLNQQRYGIAGQALLVAHNGKVIFRGATGYANLQSRERLTVDHVFPVYSLSKLFVSTLIMQLVEEGQVDLDTAASRYMPGLPARWQTITVRQFLDHTSGVPDYFDEAQAITESPSTVVFPAGLQVVFASLADKPMRFPAGTDTRYTQTNYLVLSGLLEAHYGKPYARIASERIIGRLHLTHTWLGTTQLPRSGVVKGYVGKDGTLREETDLPWPDYSLGHASLYLTLDDLAGFLQAVRTGKIVSQSGLLRFWQPRVLVGGKSGWFASGWEVGDSGAFRSAGHDGGAKVRVRVLFRDSLDGDVYTFIYLTNGSARNVWSRTLVDSAMAVVAPGQFPAEALSEKLIGYALQPSSGRNPAAFADSIRADSPLDGVDLERAINNTGYAVKENLGNDTATPIFALNTDMFPKSANTWDSLADAYAARGDEEKAKVLRDKAHRLSAEQAK